MYKRQAGGCGGGPFVLVGVGRGRVLRCPGPVGAVVLRTGEVAHPAQRGEQQRQWYGEDADGAPEQGRARAVGLGEGSADERAERQGAPHEEAQGGVHPAQQAWRAHPLAEADLGDVVDDGAEGDDRGSGGEEDRPGGTVRGQGPQQGEGAGHEEGQEDDPGLPQPCGEAPGAQRAEEPADGRRGQHQAEPAGLQSYGADEMHGLRGHEDGRAEVGEAGGEGDDTEQGVAEDEADALADLLAQRGPGRGGFGCFLGPRDPCEEQGGEQVADGVDDDGELRSDELDESAADAGAGDVGGGTDRLQRAVAGDELVAGQDLRQVALVGDVEEHGRHAGHERDGVELGHGQDVGERGGGDARHGRGAHQVRPDHQGPFAHAVGECPGGQPDEQEGGGLRRGQEAHLEGGGVECEDGYEGQCHQGHLGTELSGGGSREQQSEVTQAHGATGATGGGAVCVGHVNDIHRFIAQQSKETCQFRTCFAALRTQPGKSFVLPRVPPRKFRRTPQATRGGWDKGGQGGARGPSGGPYRE